MKKLIFLISTFILFQNSLFGSLQSFTPTTFDSITPIFESFESVNPLQFWTQLSYNAAIVSSTGYNPPTTPIFGNKLLDIRTLNYSQNQRIAIATMPISNLTHFDQLKFWMHRNNAGSQNLNRLEVYFSSSLDTNNGVKALTIFRHITLPPIVNQNGWYEYSVNVPADTFRYIIFVGIPDYYGNIHIDNIFIGPIDYCFPPPNSSVNISNITNQSAIINWNSGNLESEWEISYKSDTDTNWSIVQVTDTNYLLNNLTPLTLYQLRIRSLCDTNTQEHYTDTFTFATNCSPITNLPILEDFETTLVGEIPNCYSKISTGIAEVLVSNYSAANTKALQLKKTTQSEQSICILPKISSSIMGKRVKFKYYSTATSNIKIGYITNISQSNSFVELSNMTLTPNSTVNNWYVYDIPENLILTGLERIAIQLVNNTSSCYIDSLIILNTPTCEIPVNFTVSNITPTSATLNWAAGSIGIAQNYNIQYRISGATQWDSILNISPPFLLNQLSEHSLYEYRVQTNCTNNTQSEWSSNYYFTTTCSPISMLPWFENFNSYPVGLTIPTCWSLKNSQNNSTAIDSIYNSDNYYRLYKYNSNNQKVYAITPKFDNNLSFNNLIIEFDLYLNNPTDTLYVGFMADPTDTSTFVIIRKVTTGFTNRFHHIVVMGGNYTGTARHIAFMIQKSAVVFLIDNVKISALPQCLPSVDLNVKYNTNGTTTLNWIDYGSANNWEIEYGPSGFTHGNGTILNSYLTNYTLNNLTFGQTYDFYVKSICSSGSSNWSNKASVIVGQVLMEKKIDSLFTCNSYLMNDGGLTGPRIGNFSDTITLFPSSSYSLISVSGIFSGLPYVNYTNDYFKIYDGVGTSGALLYFLYDTTTAIIPTITSSTGPLTVVYQCNDLSRKSKFTLHVECVPGPLCFAPLNINALTSTQNSITLSWNDISNPTFWQIEYGPAGYTQGTGTIVQANSNPFQISSLNLSTEYDFYIRSICNSIDTSLWSSKFRFKTTCNPVNLPIFESFESDTIIPSCWQSYATTQNFTVTNIGVQPNCSPYHGSKMLKYNSYNIPANNYAYIISPPINLNGLSVRITFQTYRGIYGSPTSPEGITIYVNNNTSLIGADTLLFVPRLSSQNGWSYETLNTPTNMVGVKYFIFRAYSNYGYNQYLDDIKIEYVYPPCYPPSNIQASNIEATSADVSWSAANNETRWVIHCYSYSAPGTINDTVIGTPTVHLTGLYPDHEYNFYIKSECYPNIFSYNVLATFTTDTVVCNPVSNVYIENSSISNNSATVRWQPGGNEIGWRVKYKRSFDANWATSPVIDSNSYKMTGLQSNTIYNVNVQSVCLYNESIPSNTHQFSTAGGFYYTIQAQSTGAGTILPSGTLNAYSGSSQTFIFHPSSGNQVSSILVDNVLYNYSDTSYTFNNILENHTIVVNFTTGIEEYKDKKNILLYPNPTQSLLEIKIDPNFDNDLIKMIHIYNSIGELVIQKSINSETCQLDLSKLAQGIYYCQVITIGEIFVKKITKY